MDTQSKETASKLRDITKSGYPSSALGRLGPTTGPAGASRALEAGLKGRAATYASRPAGALPARDWAQCAVMPERIAAIRVRIGGSALRHRGQEHHEEAEKPRPPDAMPHHYRNKKMVYKRKEIYRNGLEVEKN